MRPAGRYIARGALAVTGLALAIMAVSALGLMTTAGQAIALRLASYFASGDGRTVAIGQLRGSLFSEGRIAEVAVGDGSGDWLYVRDIRFSWSPMRLLAGELDIAYVTVAHVDVLRAPQTPDAADEAPAEAGSSNSSGLPLIAIAARRLEIARVSLGEPLLGMAAQLSVAARAELKDRSNALSAALDVKRLDGPGGSLALNGDYSAHSHGLRVQAAVSEPANGLIATALDLPERPPLDFKFNGAGPIDAWRAQWSMAAAQQPFLAGEARVDRGAAGHSFALQSEGYLQHLVPRVLAGVLSGKTTLRAAGAVSAEQAFNLQQLAIRSDVLHVSASGGADLQAPYFHGNIIAKLAAPAAEADVSDNDANVNADAGSAPAVQRQASGVPINLASGAVVRLGAVDLRVSIPDRRTARQLDVSFDARAIEGPFGSIASVAGAASARQAAPLGVSALDAMDGKLQLVADGIALNDAALATALGSKVALTVSNAAHRQGAFTLDGARLQTAAATVTANVAGALEAIAAKANVQLADLGRLAGFVGDSASGQAAFVATANISRGDGAMTAAIKGGVENAAFGAAALDGLLGGTTQLDAQVAADPKGRLALQTFNVAGRNLHIQASGDGLEQLAGDAPERSRTRTLFNRDALKLDVRGGIKDLTRVSPDLAGALALDAAIDGRASALTSDVKLGGDNIRLRGKPLRGAEVAFAGRGPLSAHAGDLKISGNLDGTAIEGAGRIGQDEAGAVFVDKLRLSLGTLRVAADVRLPPEGRASGQVDLNAPQLGVLSPFVGQPLSGSAKANVVLQAAGEPAIAIRANAPAVRAGTTTLSKLAASIDVLDYVHALRFSGVATVAAIDAGGTRIDSVRFEARDSDGASSFRLGAAIDDDGRIDAAGMLAQSGDTSTLTLSQLTAKLSGIATSLDGPARIVSRNGDTDIERLILKAGSGRIQVAGRVSGEALDIKADVKRLPAALANAFDDTLGLEGVIDGNVVVRGAASMPNANAKLKWSGAAAAATRAQFLPPLSVDLAATMKDGIARADVAASGVQGLSLKASGEYSIKGERITRARLDGTVPLALANPALADRDTRMSGVLHIEAGASGRVNAPEVAGEATLAGVQINDPSSGLKLVNVQGRTTFTRSAVTIERVTANGDKGGTLALSGRVLLVEGGDPAINVKLDVAGLKFDDREMMSGEVDGNLTVDGTLASLRAGGLVEIKRLDIIVPSQMPHSVTSLDLKHVNAPPDSYAGRMKPKAVSERDSTPMAVSIDLRVEAANRIFVRGRGLDVQLGGALGITGTADRPSAKGGFATERGTLDILGRQLSFKHGRLIFTGDLEPSLDMEAVAEADGATISVFVSGPASAPKFRFSSSPALPEDEVVARLLFNKSLAKLSPMQLATLAGEIDKIGGLSSGPSTFDQVKGALGVDVLDVTTGADNSPEVSAGKYVDENTYVGVRQGSSASSSRVIIDHDLTKNLKARGELGADGNSKIGVGVEWDY